MAVFLGDAVLPSTIADCRAHEEAAS
jgi:hypothetical protein